MLQTLDPVFLLAAVPGDVAYPVAVAMGGAIATLYRNSRKDSIDAIVALKDAGHAIEKLAASHEKLTELVSKEQSDRVANG